MGAAWAAGAGAVAGAGAGAAAAAGAGTGAGAAAAASAPRADDEVVFELLNGVTLVRRRDAFKGLPDSMPGRMLANADFSAERRLFSFKECSRRTFASALTCAKTGETVRIPSWEDGIYVDMVKFFKELKYLCVDVEPDRALPEPLRKQLVDAGDLLCRQLESIDIDDVLIGARPYVALGMPVFCAEHVRDAKAALALLPAFEAAERAAPGFSDLGLERFGIRAQRLIASSSSFESFRAFEPLLRYTALAQLPPNSRLVGGARESIGDVQMTLEAFMSAARVTCVGIRATSMLGSDEVPYVKMRVHQALAGRGLNSTIYVHAGWRNPAAHDDGRVLTSAGVFPMKTGLMPFFQGVEAEGNIVSRIFPFKVARSERKEDKASLVEAFVFDTLNVIVHKEAGTRRLNSE
jgi:hypothetical protein